MPKTLLLGTSFLFATSALFPAVAQIDDEDTDTIVVTATKREQTLQEVPIAVSVVDGEVIERAQINDIIDLQSVVPSLRVSQLQQSGNATFIIRGFGNGANNTGIEPSVGVFIDGVYRTRSAGAIGDFPDVERVEVLRGPQSTLFGKNASAGIISFVTAAPSFDWGGKVEATLGNYDQTILKGYLTGPMSENTAFSIAGTVNQREGYAENMGGAADLNERDRWSLRGQMLYEASDNVSVRLIADYDKVDESCCYTPFIQVGPATLGLLSLGGQAASDPFAYEAFTDRDAENEIINYGGSAQVNIAMDWADLTSITALRKQELYQTGDVDFTSVPALSDNVLDNNIETFTQELRLSGSTERFDWLLGGFYFKEDVEVFNNIVQGPQFRAFTDILSSGGVTQAEAALGFAPGTFFADGNGSFDFFTQDNESYSVFGQTDFAITDRLTATVGLAYTHDEKEVTAFTNNTEPFYAIDLQEATDERFSQLIFATAFTTATGLPATPTNINNFAGANPTLFAQIQAGADAQFAALNDVPCSATNPPPACDQLLGITALAPLQFLPPFVAFPNDVEDGSTDDDNVTYTLRLAYDVTPFVNVYASYATGFKASSWNLTRDSSYFARDAAALDAAGLLVPNRRPGTRYAGPEYTKVYEIGLKADFERVDINLALFDQTIEGFQSVIFQGTGFSLANAGEQSAIGFEIDTTWNPVDPLTLVFSGTFLDPEYDSFVGAPAVDANGNQAIIDLSGETPAGIHETSLYFAAQWDHDFGEGMGGFIRADYQYEDEVQIVDNVPESVGTREVSMVNASAGLSWDNGFEAFIWGRNLTDDEYFQSAFPTTAQAGSFSGYPNQPQTYGVTVRKSW
jgi:outer membrane receptor protein involved in Fe transport